ncbi:MAG: hypothetical protein ABIQ31_17800 [Ferruginibacter sp.]
MSKFVVKDVEGMNGRQAIKQLVVLDNRTDIKKIILADTKGQLEIYEENLETKYENSIEKIYALMDRLSNLRPLNDHEFKDITPRSETVKEYEFKGGDLRVYAIKIPNGKLIILGGYKNKQKQDISAFRALKKLYLKSLIG